MRGTLAEFDSLIADVKRNPEKYFGLSIF